VRYWLVASAIVVVLGATAWKIHAASLEQRADALRQAADEACGRFDFARAQAHLVEYLTLRPTDADSHLLAARCARRAEFLEDYAGPNTELADIAAGHLRDAERLGTPPVAVALERMLAGIQHGSWFNSERLLFARVKERADETPLILEGLIQGYLRRLHFEKALACADALLRLEPGNVLALLWRGRIREEIKQRAGAREDYETALQSVPDFDAARYYLAELLFNSNQVQDARKHLDILNERAGQNLLVRLMSARCLIALGDEGPGLDLVDAWLADAPPRHARLLDALNAAARAALSLGQPERAEGYARRALKESPLNQYALVDLARSLDRQGRASEARDIEHQVEKINRDLETIGRDRERLTQDPANLDVRREIGDIYLRLGRPDEALMWLNSVLDRDPEHRPTLKTLADYHSRAGNQAMAAEMQRRLDHP
jgi:tetratricopeptide (TPR) repeat protein